MNPEALQEFQNAIPIILLMIWSLIWKGFALWKAAQNEQKPWFVLILVLNSVGIAEIIYLLFFQKEGRYWERVITKLQYLIPITK